MVTIRLTARPGELTAKSCAVVASLNAATFPDDYPYPLDGAYWWVGCDGSRPVAFAGMTVEFQEAFLCRCGVLQRYRGQGLQKRLIRCRERCAWRLGCQAIATYTFHNVRSNNSLIGAGYRQYEPKNPWAGNDVTYWYKRRRV